MNTATQSCVLPDENATLAVGSHLARASEGRGVITLRGNLGSGKTTLCRGLILGLGHTGAVKSPTYTLVEPYELATGRVLHYDLYRLADPEEVEYLGMRDFLDNQTLTLIEWPEKAAGFLPPVDLELNLEVLATGRRLSWQALTPFGEKLASELP
jgi:tRNA threonylcarbamoyladenosine biosynthesis protein TsaE